MSQRLHIKGSNQHSRRGYTGFFSSVCLLFLLWLTSSSTYAQTTTYSLVAKDVPLETALTQFSEKTSIPVTFLSQTTADTRVYCVIHDAIPEEILTCLLSKTNLDYVQLSSGTYAIIVSSRAKPHYGTLRGQIVADHAQTPLSYAHILISDLNYGTTSDNAGRFVFPPMLQGTYHVTAQHLGYQIWQDSVYIAPNQSNDLSITLSPIAVSLDPIVIQVPYHQLSESLLYQEVSTRALLEQTPSLGAINALKLLSHSQGIQFSETTSDLHIQAGTSGEHQVRIDGAPVFLPQQFAGFWGPFNSLAIEQIRIHKAGFGAKMGSFQSGVMEVQQRLSLPDGKSLSVQVAPLTINALASTSQTLKGDIKLQAMGAFRHDLWPSYVPSSFKDGLRDWSALDTFPLIAPIYLADLITPETSKPYDNLSLSLNPDLGFKDYHGNLNIQLTPTRRLHSSFYHGNIEVKNNAQGINTGSENPNAGINIDDAYRWKNTTGQITFESNIGTRALASLQLRTSRFRLEHTYQLVDNVKFFTNNDNIFAQQLIEQPIADQNGIDESAAHVNFTFAQSQNHTLEVGFEVIHTRSDFQLVASHTLSLVDQILAPKEDSLAAQTRLFKDKVNNTRGAFYLEDTWHLASNLKLLPGIRWTWLAKHSSSFLEPRIALLFDSSVGSDLAIAGRLAAGLYHQFIIQHDLSTANLGAIVPSLRFWVPLQSDIQPPRSIHLTASTKVQHAKGWTLNLEAFAKLQPRTLVLNQIPDLAFNPGSQVITAESSELLIPARGYVYGISAGYQHQLDPFLVSLNAEWTHVRRRYQANLNNRYLQPAWAQPFKLNTTLHWSPANTLTVKASWQGIWGRRWAFQQVYYDNLTLANDLTVFNPYDISRPDQHKLPVHHQLDLGISWQQQNYLQIDAGILNLYDRKNIATQRLELNDTNDRFEAIPRYSLPGFALYGRISVAL